MNFDDKLQTYIKDTEKNRINFLKEAYSKLPKEIQDKINDDDITNIAKGKKIEKTPELEELHKEQEKLFNEKEKELVGDLSKELKIGFEDSKSIFAELKRYAVCGGVAGIPGIMIMLIYDLLQERHIKNEFTDRVEKAIKNENFTDINQSFKNVQSKVGKVVSVEKLEDLLKSSDTYLKIRENKDLRKEVSSNFGKLLDKSVSTVSKIKQKEEENKKTTVLEKTTKSSETEEDEEEEGGLELIDTMFIK